MKFSPDRFLERLPLPPDEKWVDGVRDIEFFAMNGISLVLFAPRGVDRQTKHDEDEFYFIVRGSGEILIGGERSRFAAGDAFFVAAGVEHRFEDFSDDLVTWAVFF
jgi:mannose-6-phosphate isomerase-like protein (cupin superfamily)